MNEWAWSYACGCVARTPRREQGPAAPGDPPSDDVEVTCNARHLQHNNICKEDSSQDQRASDLACMEAMICV